MTQTEWDERQSDLGFVAVIEEDDDCEMCADLGMRVAAVTGGLCTRHAKYLRHA